MARSSAKRRNCTALVEADAIALMDRFGADACPAALDRGRAERRGAVVDGSRPRRHWVRVKLRIAELTGRDVGLDTATRYLARPCEGAADEPPRVSRQL